MVDLKDEEKEIADLLKEMENADGADLEPGAGDDQAFEDDSEGEITAGPAAKDRREEADLDDVLSSGDDDETKPGVATDDDGQQRMVPQPALHAERAKRQELEERLATIMQERRQDQERIGHTQGELSALKEMLQGEITRRQTDAKAAEDAASRPKLKDLVRIPQEDDPDFSLRAYHEAVNQNSEAREHNMRIELEARAEARAAELLEQQMKPINEAFQSHRQTQDQQTQLGQLRDAVDQREAAFAQRSPDYYQAIKAYKDAKFRDYTEVMGLPPARAIQQVSQDMVSEAHNFLVQGMDPATTWYGLAKHRGYNGPEASEPATPAPAQRQNGRRSSVGAMAAGMASSDGLSQAASSGGATQPDAESALSTILDTKDDAWLNANMDKIEALIARVEGRN
jgi:hypothetical protein